MNVYVVIADVWQINAFEKLLGLLILWYNHSLYAWASVKLYRT